MKKIYISLLVSVLLIAGCQPSETMIQTAIAKTQAAMPAVTQAPTIGPVAANAPTGDLLDYTQKLTSIYERFNKNYNGYEDHLFKIQDDANIILDPTWKKNIGDASVLLLVSTTEMKTIEPVPQKLESLNGHVHSLADAVEDLIQGVNNLIDSPNAENTQKITGYLTKIGEFSDLVNSDLKQQTNSTPSEASGQKFENDQTQLQDDLNQYDKTNGDALRDQNDKGGYSATDEDIWQFCRDRWAYYDQQNGGYAGDTYTSKVFQEAASKFGISASEAESIWQKVDAKKLGLE